ncbi:hypothetical protein [Deinococcus hopiensis]|uniref:Uncharacterized protein n=1 Tax=Deinococcus hopiensis KR-140 TaxID=695939 RepID=A0A1W1UPM1_9DEIO|nr:hypothetical protein [Deinococcus hopiensis]SMB82983.1 hypothetical protein SAMN00790413_04219 [Deinococcus hopiensis KR-140]
MSEPSPPQRTGCLTLGLKAGGIALLLFSVNVVFYITVWGLAGSENDQQVRTVALIGLFTAGLLIWGMFRLGRLGRPARVPPSSGPPSPLERQKARQSVYLRFLLLLLVGGGWYAYTSWGPNIF